MSPGTEMRAWYRLGNRDWENDSGQKGGGVDRNPLLGADNYNACTLLIEAYRLLCDYSRGMLAKNELLVSI